MGGSSRSTDVSYNQMAEWYHPIPAPWSVLDFYSRWPPGGVETILATVFDIFVITYVLGEIFFPSKDIAMEGVNANLGHGEVLWWEAMGGIKSENLKTSRRYSHCTYRPAYMGQCLVRADVGEDRWSYITCNVGLLAAPGPARLWNRLTFSFSWGDTACTLPKYLLMLKLILQAVCFTIYIFYMFKKSNAMQQVSSPTRKWELTRNKIK